MKHLGMRRRALLGAVMAAATLTTAGQAQEAAAPPPPGQGGKELVVNCCRCIGEEGKPISLNTGAAPWTVTKTPTAAWGTVPQWQAAALSGATNPTPQTVPGNLGTNPLPGTWTNALAPASWLQPNPGSTMGGYANGHYTYTLKIRVPNCRIKQKVTISGQFAADDISAMVVSGPGMGSGVQTPLSGPSYPVWHGGGFGTNAIATFSQQLGTPSHTPAGVYTVRIEVDNLGGGPTGMVLNGIAKGKCDDRLEKGKDERD